MREIKFRGQRFDTKEWIHGSLLEDDIIVTKGATDVDSDYIDFSDDWSSVIKETVGQYTGLKDKNGNEIYEGDIVKEKYIKPLLVVKYDENECSFVSTSIDSDINYGIQLGNTSNYEVIGNIHENPELLEGRE